VPASMAPRRCPMTLAISANTPLSPDAFGDNAEPAPRTSSSAHSDRARATSLKKRLVSRGSSMESKSISVGFRTARVEVEARGSAAGAIPRNRQAGGRAVKAGPGGGRP
jgi:hypothetical protein